MGFIDKIISQLAPHDCLGCGQEASLLCLDCGLSLPGAFESGPVGYLSSASAVTSYDYIARELVRQLKFRGAQAAVDVMARHMSCLVPTKIKDALIVPVPTATRRIRQRGFDQAGLLARQLSRHTGLQYTDCLRRRGQTHQVGASREQRLSQLQDAFYLKKKADLGARAVILVDDVLTTGATLEAAAGILQKAGLKRIHAVVFAQAAWRDK